MVDFSKIDEELIKIDPEADENMLVKKFEKDADKPLYAGQSERILISLISYYANIVMSRVNEAFKMFFLRFMNRFFLELWGEMVDCPPLEATQAHDVLEIKLYEPFSTDKTLPKGSKIYTKDGEYIFTTDENLTIPAGQTTGRVSITSELAGSLLNHYAAGEINELVENYPYIESVTNINGASGGEDAEETEHYRGRLYLAPSKFSVAGPELAYKFYAMSAHQSICDVEVVTPDLSASIEVDGTIYPFETNSIDNELLSASVDYASGAVNIAAKTPLSGLKVVVPPVFTIYIYVLTDKGAASDEILELVRKKLDSQTVRPMLDNVLVFSAVQADDTLDIDIEITEDADLEKVQISVNNALQTFIETIGKKLNAEIVPEQLISLLGSIEGVYRVLPKNMDIRPKITGTFYKCTIGSINYRRI